MDALVELGCYLGVLAIGGCYKLIKNEKESIN